MKRAWRSTVADDRSDRYEHPSRCHPYHTAAGRVWELTEQGTVEAYVSAISFNNIFYIARRQVGRDRALDAVKRVRQLFRFAPFTETMLDGAIATPGVDFRLPPRFTLEPIT